MGKSLLAQLERETQSLIEKGLYKSERLITSPQGATISVDSGFTGDGGPGGQNRPGDDGPAEVSDVINLCANNYLGLSNDPTVIQAARKALDNHGFGMSSVRFICGTQDIHKRLESRLSGFLGMEDTILYSSCFDANTGLFETILGEEDAIISDALNHASIIDGIRLCKARRLRYANNDMTALEDCLKQAQDCRFRLIATDGVFSMDGIIANLPAICDLAERYDAMVMVDDSHAVGFIGENGRGTPELCGVSDRVDILTGTLGKALGGASGGYVSAAREIVTWLRQRSRPYLFSNSLAPMIVETSITVLDLLEGNGAARERLRGNSRFFRSGLQDLGFELVPGEHPIIPVMLGDAKLAGEMSRLLYDDGIYVTGFSFPVVPEGKARIRTQMSAAHSQAQLAKALDAFAKAGRALGIIA
jgi:glycine C-acetyltransferase